MEIDNVNQDDVLQVRVALRWSCDTDGKFTVYGHDGWASANSGKHGAQKNVPLFGLSGDLVISIEVIDDEAKARWVCQ